MRRLSVPGGMPLVGLLCYCLVLSPFSTCMRSKPVIENIGYVPSLKFFKSLSTDQKELTAASLVFKVLMYYGGLLTHAPAGQLFSQPPDLRGMSRLLHGAVQLDPYNMDAYYFAQSFLTWDARQYKVANELLDYGMKYRTWDWQLPYFAGFNAAFFLKDATKAADYYQTAGELSGQPLHRSLASRYLQESGQTELAIAYLSSMVRTAKNEAIKQTYLVRLESFREVRRIELARDQFRAKHQEQPESVEQLVRTGYLHPAPSDPYGGRFYLDHMGRVTSTSKFAFTSKSK